MRDETLVEEPATKQNVWYLTGVNVVTGSGPWSKIGFYFWPSFVNEFDTPKSPKQDVPTL